MRAAFAVTCLAGVVLASLALAAPARAEPPVRLVLKNHMLTPAQVTAPAGQRFKIEVVNQDDSVAEFESYDLKVEKIVVGGGTVTVSAGPLHPGTYKLFDDYHPDTAHGVLTVAAAE